MFEEKGISSPLIPPKKECRRHLAAKSVANVSCWIGVPGDQQAGGGGPDCTGVQQCLFMGKKCLGGALSRM